MSNDLHFRIVNLRKLDPMAVRQFGAKATNLASLMGAGIRVPPGIAIGRDALAHFLAENQISLSALERIHDLGVTFQESALAEAQDWQTKIVDAINSGKFPQDLVDAIHLELKPLQASSYAVRSSSINEDASIASFAGQYASVLNVHGEEALLTAMRSCWASQYSGRVLNYAISRRGVPVLIPSMAILIQAMINAEFGGVCFTEGPTPKTKRFMIVESVRGIGDVLVGGLETPCHFELNRDGSIHRVISPSNSMEVPSEPMISRLAEQCTRIANHFGGPQDVEWAIVGKEVFILQARPITIVGGERKVSLLVGTTVADRKSILHESRESILRDELHDWLITQVDPLVLRGAANLLLEQQLDGSWKLEFNPEWGIVVTAMIVGLLIDGGIPPTLRWNPPVSGSSKAAIGIPAAISWLIQRASEEGMWGTDLWDSCQVIRALIRAGLGKDEPLIAASIRNLEGEIMREYKSVSQQEWFGPGVFAVALHLYDEIGMPDSANGFADLLLQTQAPDGDYLGPHYSGGQPRVPSVWHTAQATTALAKCTSREGRFGVSIERACNWLISRQHSDGSWGVSAEPYSRYNTFFTSYAMIALHSAGFKYQDAVERAYKWIRGRQRASGSFGDVASSLMAMSAIQQIGGPAFSVLLPFPIFMRIQSTLGNLGSDQNRGGT